MEDKAAELSDHIKAWTVPVRKGDAKRVQADLVERATDHGAQVLVLDADMVFGLDHIHASYCHAKAAIDGRRAASDSISMETLLYASGERQLSSAIKKMSLKDASEKAVIAWLGGNALQPEPSWTPLPVIERDGERARLARFGLSEQELSTVSSDRATELVLEKVAAVDILKK